MVAIAPFLWFDKDLAEVIDYYSSVFPGTVARDVQRAGDDGPVFGASIEIHDQTIMLLNGGPFHAGFTEAISLFVSVETQDEIDDLWDRLTADGGQESRCGWLKDRYGLSWQIVPSMLGSVLGGPDPVRAGRARDSMMTMAKLDIATLRAAYDR